MFGFFFKDLQRFFFVSLDPVIKRQLSAAGDNMSTAIHSANWSSKKQIVGHQHKESSAENSTNGSCSELESLLPNDNYQEDQDAFEWQPLNTDKTKNTKPKFEAYMMTGEHILKVSSHTPQTSLMSKKKLESLRHNNHNLKHHHHNSTPTSPNETDIGKQLAFNILRSPADRFIFSRL